MKFQALPLAGAWLVIAEPIEDERGSFARTWCIQEIERQGLNPKVVQCSRSHNKRAGTLRGMHYQKMPFGECKWVRCTQGRIFDVILDLRSDSATYGKWHGVELEASRPASLYIPVGFAHGFITLSDDAVVEYQISELFRPEAAAGVRWNDPAFGIVWPREPAVISNRDASYPDFSP